eukprot:5430522-Amphidinium_carterae.1
MLHRLACRCCRHMCLHPFCPWATCSCGCSVIVPTGNDSHLLLLRARALGCTPGILGIASRPEASLVLNRHRHQSERSEHTQTQRRYGLARLSVSTPYFTPCHGPCGFQRVMDLGAVAQAISRIDNTRKRVETLAGCTFGYDVAVAVSLFERLRM